MLQHASTHGDAGSVGGEAAAGTVWLSDAHMSTHDSSNDFEASHGTWGRYAGFGTEGGYLVYDTENRSAWIESDTTRSLADLS